jgi:hypothetical protein
MGPRDGESEGNMVFENLARELLAIGDYVRYVAVGEGQRITTAQRNGLESPSASDSDRFEELFVNPALVTLARQRGELDCGGLRHIVVAYGNFIQLVMPTRSGHVSIAVEGGTDVGPVSEATSHLLRSHGFLQQEIR